MAIIHHNSGPGLVKFNSKTLGYSRDGVDFRITPFWDTVASDDFGGQGSMPSDKQFLGAIGHAVCELVKYEEVNVNLLVTFAGGNNAIEGKICAPGTFVRQNGLAKELIVAASEETYAMPVAHVAEPPEWNVSTKHKKVLLHFEFWIENVTALALFTRTDTSQNVAK